MSTGVQDADDAQSLVARRLRTTRAALGASRVAVAVWAGVDPGHLRRLEEGAVDPRLSTLLRLARALGVGVGELVVDDAPPRPAPPARGPSLGRALQRARAERGVTRADLARRASVSPQYLQRVESDRQSPTVRVLRRLAEALGVSAGVLVDGASPVRRGSV